MRLGAYLRTNWFAIFAIVITIFYGRIIAIFVPPTPSLDWDPVLKNVDYWSLISNPNMSQLILIGFICLGLLSGVFAFVYILPPSKTIYHLFLVLVFLFLCTLSNCSSSLKLKAGRRIEHVMSITYQSKVYHLALSTYSEAFGEAWSSYYIFECDSSGKVCSKIKDIDLVCCDYSGAQLLISDDKLILQHRSEQMQIAPAVNGSS